MSVFHSRATIGTLDRIAISSSRGPFASKSQQHALALETAATELSEIRRERAGPFALAVDG
jgi:hypothetical protein